jgi:hypothetical protein
MPKTPADIANETLQVKRSIRLQKINTPEGSPPCQGERKRYEVQFTFTDNQDPYTQVDYCPKNIVEANLVEPEVARKWLDAVKKQQELGTPRTRARKRGTTTALPTKKKKIKSWMTRLRTTTLTLAKTQH